METRLLDLYKSSQFPATVLLMGELVYICVRDDSSISVTRLISKHDMPHQYMHSCSARGVIRVSIGRGVEKFVCIA